MSELGEEFARSRLLTLAACPLSFGPADQRLNPGRHGVDVFMVPQALDRPARCSERSIDCPISIDVCLELREPVPAVTVGHRTALGARVPETAVDEDGELEPGEHDVGSDPNPISADQEVLAEAKTTAMKRRTQADLWLRVGSTVCLSDLRCRSVDRLRIGNPPPATERHGSTRRRG